MSRKGKIVEIIATGEKAVVYEENLIGYDRIVLNLVDKDLNPKIDEGTGKKLISVKKISEVKFIGFID